MESVRNITVHGMQYNAVIITHWHTHTLTYTHIITHIHTYTYILILSTFSVQVDTEWDR